MTEKKKPEEWTTKEALRRLFPKPLRDAVEDAVVDVDDPTPDEPTPRKKHSTRET